MRDKNTWSHDQTHDCDMIIHDSTVDDLSLSPLPSLLSCHDKGKKAKKYIFILWGHMCFV